MEEDWDIVDSLHSSTSSNNKRNQQSASPVELNFHRFENSNSTSLELNFNRFENQVEFVIKDEVDVDVYEQQLRDEGVIFCDSPSPDEEEGAYEEQEEQEDQEISIELQQEEQLEGEEEVEYINQEYSEQEEEEDEELNFTLGDRKLMIDETANINNDDVHDIRDNEPEQQRINQYKNHYLSSLFPANEKNPFSFMNNQVTQEENSTRESQVDKTATWVNATTGSSIPYVSNDIPKLFIEKPSLPKQKQPFFPGGLNFGSGGFTLPAAKVQNVTQKLQQLEVKYDDDSSNSSVDLSAPVNNTSNNDDDARPASSRPIKQMRRRLEPPKPTLDMNTLPSFAASPKIPNMTMNTLPAISNSPTAASELTYEVLINTIVDIPPEEPRESESEEESHEEEEEIKYEQDPEMIKTNLEQCFQFYSDNRDQNMSRIFYEVEQRLPDVTQWYQLTSLNLSRQNISSLDNLKNCFPFLETLKISHNKLKSIYGLPDSLCYLHASHNNFSDLDIYQLSKLLYLDVSNNLLKTFGDMSELKALRTLDASYNNISSCKPFQTVPGLILLSLKGNSIRKLTGFVNNQLNQQLESLDLSFNRIECLDSVDSLQHLRELNMDHNDVKCVHLDQPMDRLCKLKLSFNRLKSFDVSPFSDIRILYLDDNQIQRIIGVACITKLDSFSMRDQGGHKVEYNLQYLRGTRKLYLSGSPFRNMHQLIDFYTLEYLELCSAELEGLPADFCKQVPNLCTLYLSMNRLQDIRPLRKLKYLKTLILIENRLLSLNEVLSTVKHLKRLHQLDLRNNPLCANIYPPVNLTIAENLHEREKISHYIKTARDDTWEENDLEFSQQLTDHWRTRREVYRALIIKECPKLAELDHIPVAVNDRSFGDLVIQNFYKARTPNPA